MSKSKHICINIAGGFGWRFGVGFEIDKYSFSLTIGPFWLAVEW